MKVFIRTYGCQMNARDSDAVAARLQQHGYLLAASEEDADIVIVNTCSVRSKAEDKAIGKLRLLTTPRRRRPGQLVGVMGCMVQHLQERLMDQVHGLDFAVGTQQLHRMPEILACVQAGEGPIVVTEEGQVDTGLLAGHSVNAPVGFVNILFGCNRRCTYCIVPRVRGEEWSRPAAEVLDEVRSLAAAGAKDVTLLGQSVMSYGRANPVWPDHCASPLGFREPLARLLEAAGAVPGIERLRFTSGHPSGCTPELVRAMQMVPTVCEHLHLPLQSGSDRILARMRRGYTSDEYRQAVRRLRAAVPDLALTTDIIVGFPSETVEEFEQTRTFMSEMEFDNSFIFKYSPRPDTPAAEWPDDVPAEEKLRRNHVLLEEQNVRGVALNRRVLGQAVEVLAEGPSARNPARWSGRTRTNKIVLFDAQESVTPGQFVTLCVRRCLPQTLYGELPESGLGGGRIGEHGSGGCNDEAEPVSAVEMSA